MHVTFKIYFIYAEVLSLNFNIYTFYEKKKKEVIRKFCLRKCSPTLLYPLVGITNTGYA